MMNSFKIFRVFEKNLRWLLLSAYLGSWLPWQFGLDFWKTSITIQKFWATSQVMILNLALVPVWGTVPFSSPEAALLLVSTKNRDLWPGPTSEVRDSRTSRHSAHVQSQFWQIWLVVVSIYCVYNAIQKRNVVGPCQRSRFLVLTKRSAASGDENGTVHVDT